jgi:hypothetical protein
MGEPNRPEIKNGNSCYGHIDNDFWNGIPEVFRNGSCYSDNTGYFNTLTYGNGGTSYDGNKIYGVTRSAMAVGRFIMIDAILASLPLTDAKITCSETSIGLEKGSKSTFSAYAKDPDAIRFELIEGKPDDGNYKNYRIQYDRNAHEMYYRWEFTCENGEKKFFPGKEVSDYKNDEMIIEIVDSTGLTGKDDKRAGLLSVLIKGKDKDSLPLKIKVENSQFIVKARMMDDEGDTTSAIKTVMINNRLPEPEIWFSKNNTDDIVPYIALVPVKDFGEYEQKNKFKVHSGFGNPKCFEPLYINGFRHLNPKINSSTPGFTNADQIAKVSYDIDFNNTYEIELSGINKQSEHTNADAFDNKENRFAVKTSFRLVPQDEFKAIGKPQTYYLSSAWNNKNSPDTLPQITYSNLLLNQKNKIQVKVTDIKLSSVVDTAIVYVLVPPTIDTAYFETKNLCSNGNEKQYKIGEKITLSKTPDDVIVIFNAKASENKSINNNGNSYVWGFKGADSSTISLTNPDWDITDLLILENGANRSYQELLKLGLEANNIYEIILKVTDNANSVTQVKNGSGITMMKVGEIVLEP